MKNENTSHPNKNTLYLARSGGGKSQALKQNPAIPASGARVLLFDPGRDHKAHHYSNLADFAKAVKKAEASGRGYRIGYCGERWPPCKTDAHEFFCRVALAVLDGSKLTYIIDEEISGSTKTAGKAERNYARLMNEGRKYGLVYHGTSQRPQEIPKTVYENCEVLFVGRLKAHSARYLANEIEVKPGELTTLEPLEFFHYDNNGTTKIKLKYRK